MIRKFLLPLLGALALSQAGCQLAASLIKTALPVAGIKYALACLPAGTWIDTPQGPRRVDGIEPGEWVIGYAGQPVRVLQKHSYLESSQTTFFRVDFGSGKTVTLCGMHRICGERAKTLVPGQMLEGRRISAVTSFVGVQKSFDLLTEDAGYQISGVPVNSMIEEMAAAAANGRLPE